MALMANDKGGTDFEPIAQGVHHAICYGLFDLGTQFSEKFGNFSHKILICWEIPEERIKIKKDDKELDLPRAVSKEYTLSLGMKANLRKDLETWRGRAFTPDELSGFDVKNILGKNCFIQIIHQPKGEKVYANVASITPLMKGVQAKNPENIISCTLADNIAQANNEDYAENFVKKYNNQKLELSNSTYKILRKIK